MITERMTGRQVLDAAQKTRARLGAGINESIPMTPRSPHGLSRKQIIRDGKIAKELVYLSDVRNDQRALVAAFYENRALLSDFRYWEFVKFVWVRAGTLELVPMFRQLFASKRPFSYWIMSPEEEAQLKALPEQITVWRAPRPGGDDGFSWSILRGFVAEFAAKNGREVVERVVQKKDIFAYFDRRGEGEVIIL